MSRHARDYSDTHLRFKQAYFLLVRGDNIIFLTVLDSPLGCLGPLPNVCLGASKVDQITFISTEALTASVMTISAALKGAARKQFLSAWEENPRFSQRRNSLWNLYLSKNLVNKQDGWHVCLTGRADYQARRHVHAEHLLASSVHHYEVQEQSPLFTNGMHIPKQSSALYGYDERGHPRWGPPPSQRTANIGFIVITLEIDKAEREFLEAQLSWLRSPNGKPVKSPLGQVIKRLGRFLDFRGVTAVYGGNKSVHLHFVFDTRHLSLTLCQSNRLLQERWQGDVPEALLRTLYEQAWLRVVGEFKQVISCTEPFDPQLKRYEQLRRTPWGIRLAPEGHLLGVAPGTPVPQLVLFEWLMTRAPNGATEWFIHPDHCASIESPRPATPRARRARDEASASLGLDAVLDGLRTYCRNIWNQDYPEPVLVTNIDGEPAVYFRNNPDDVHPSTVVRGDYRKLMIQGRNDFHRAFLLPQGLDDTLRMITGDMTTSSPSPLPAVKGAEGANWLECKFACAATDADGARKALGQVLLLAARRQPITLIKSVEGIGKTSALMAELPHIRLDMWFDDAQANQWRECNQLPTYPPPARLSGFAAFSFGTYEQAEAKRREFNRLHSRRQRVSVVLSQWRSFLRSTSLSSSACSTSDAQPDGAAFTSDVDAHPQKRSRRSYRLSSDTRSKFRFPERTLLSDRALFKGKVLRSVHNLYEVVCAELGEERLTYKDIACAGLPSFLPAVEHLQPHIYSRMCEHRDAFWGVGANGEPRDFDPLRTVLFMVHDVTRRWGDQTSARLWWHPHYERFRHDASKRDQIRNEMMISDVVYDEVTVRDLLLIHGKGAVEWCEEIKKSVPDWDSAKLPERYAAYARAAGAVDNPPSFRHVQDVIGAKYRKRDLREVDTTFAPFGRDNTDQGLYTGQQGRKYYLRPHRWWDSLGARVVFLTTEQLPTELFSSIGRMDHNRRMAKYEAESRKAVQTGSASPLPPRPRFKAYSFDQTGTFLRDCVPLVLDSRSAKDQEGKPKLSTLIEEIRAKCSDVFVITDNAGNSTNICPHKTARGRNDLADRMIVSIFTYIGGAQYAEFCLIGKEFSLPDIIRTYYRDVLFQDIGRNMGFRRSELPTSGHWVVMHPRLFDDLGGAKLWEGGRYELWQRAAITL